MNLRRRRLAIGCLAALAAAVVAPLLTELGYRLCTHRTEQGERDLKGLRELVTHGHPIYEPRYYTSYGLNSREPLRNSLGFWGPEWKVERTPGETRIICVGGSTTEGGNPLGPYGSYPTYLEQGLEQALGRPFEVMNCGVSLWTSAESLTNWFLLMQDYAPDAVILHDNVNDVEPRNSPGFRADYRHWRVPFREPPFGLVQRLLIRASDLYGDWVLRNQPQTLSTLSTQRLPGPYQTSLGPLPPETAQPFRRNVVSIGESVEGMGGRMCLMTLPICPRGDGQHDPFFLQAIEEHNQILRDLAAEHGWILIDAAARFPTYPGLDQETLWIDLVHVAPEGNKAKALLAGEALWEHWLRDQN